MKPLPDCQRILIVTVNWLGDLIFMTPAIRAIRRTYPKSRMVCLAPPRGLDLLAGNPHINAVIPFPESRGIRGLIQWGPLVSCLRTERFDAAFLFHPSFTRTLAVLTAGIPTRVGYWTWKRGWLLTHSVAAPNKDSVHKAAWYLGMVQGAGLASDGFQYDAGILPEDHSSVQTLLEEWGLASSDRIVALHPGANWELKRWSSRNFANLADQLARQRGVKVLFVGSRGDLPLVQKILKRMKTRPAVATGKTTIRQLAALLRQVQLLISNDSGPLHLGMAVGTPVIGLYGPTDPKLTGPLDSTKAATLFGSIGCPVPCYQLDCPANLCMSQITVDKVLMEARRFLGS